MSYAHETGTERPALRERPDLREQYRAIGIAAVAAAVAVEGKSRRAAQTPPQPVNDRYADSMAA